MISRVEQEVVCFKYGAKWTDTPAGQKIGIAWNVRDGLKPINGLRVAVEGDTSGWYIWAGEELSNADDLFQPLHAAHLNDWCPGIMKFLGLPPGWRFLWDGSYEDVWFDPELLKAP